MALALVKEGMQPNPKQEKLRQDALALFRQNNAPGGREIANMDQWGYSSQLHKDDPVCGGLLWDLFTLLHSEYYPKKNQVSLFQNNIEWLCSLAGRINGVIDFGCGGPGAIYNYALPLLRRLHNVSFYMPIDLCEDYLASAVAQVGETFGESIRVLPYDGDYTRPISRVPPGRKLGLFLGSSTNFKRFPEDMRGFLKAFRQTIGDDGVMVMSIDTNTDPVSVRRSYDHPLHHEQEINLIRRFLRDLNITGDLDPAAWRYGTDIEVFSYRGHTVLLALHVIIPTRPQSFFIDSDHVVVGEGERLVVDKSFKIPVELIDTLAIEQGFVPLGVRYDHQNRLAMPVYGVGR